MSIKFKLWIQALIPILCVTLFGIVSILWTTISQQRELINDVLTSNVQQVKNEIDFSRDLLVETLLDHVNNREIVHSFQALLKINDSIPELKKLFQCNAIFKLQQLLTDKEYDVIALYSMEGIESYATKNQIYVTALGTSGKPIQHFTRSASSILKQCTSKNWQSVETPIKLPKKIENPSALSTNISINEGQLNLMGNFPIKDIIYLDGEEKTVSLGTILLRKSITHDFLKNFSKKTSIKTDLFSLAGKFLTGTSELPFNIKFPMEKELATELKINNEDYFTILRPYLEQNQPVFLMASYVPRKTAEQNIKNIFFLQVAGLIVGVILAALVALFMGRFITDPIRKLKDATLKIGGGDLDTEIKVDSQDELGVLASSLNKMVQDLNRITVSRNYVDNIIKNMVDCLIVVTPEAKIQSVNQATCNLLGYQPEELINGEIGVIFADENSSSSLYSHAFLKNLIKKDVVSNLEETFLSKDRRKIPVLFSSSVMRCKNGNITDIVCVGTDITKLKRAEETLKSSNEIINSINKVQSQYIANTTPGKLFENILNDLLALTKSEYGFIGEILHTNMGEPYLKTFAITNIAWDKETKEFYEKNKVLGLEFSNMETLFGEVIKTGIPVIFNDPATDSRAGGIPAGHPPLNFFLGVPIYHGKTLLGMAGLANRSNSYEEYWIKTLNPVLNTCGNIITAYKNEQKRIQVEKELEIHRSHLEELVEERTSELRSSQVQLAHADKLNSLGKLTASIAHEFNNPLYGVQMALELIGDDQHDEDHHEKFRSLGIKECKRMADLIRQLQTFYRPTSGEAKPVYINRIIEEILLFSEKQIKERDITIKTKLSSNIPEILLTEDQIKQVLLNLIHNAEESILDSQSEKFIMISTQYKNSSLEIIIQDSGVGIPEGQIENIFEPFHTTKSTVSGTGLGLSVSYGIVKSHGGKIRVTSELGKGTTFTVSIPDKGTP